VLSKSRRAVIDGGAVLPMVSLLKSGRAAHPFPFQLN
jgi:hypothetical protein